MGSHSKDIKRIEDKKYIKKNNKNITVDYNNIDYFEQNDKLEIKRNNKSKTNNSQIDSKNYKSMHSKNFKDGAIFANGSNFEIMNLQCGI